jgi:hypothetical protein
MIETIVPSEKWLKGVWLLDQEKLTELEEKLCEIYCQIKEWDNDYLEKLIADVESKEYKEMQRKEYATKESFYYYCHFSDKTRLQFNNIEDFFREHDSIAKKKAENLIIIIRTKNNRIKIQLGDSCYYEIEAETEEKKKTLINKITYIIEANRESKIIGLWKSNGIPVFIGSLFSIALYLTNIFGLLDTNSTRQNIKEQVTNIYITKSDISIDEKIDLILKLSADYKDPNSITKKEPINIYFIIVYSVTAIIFLIHPRSVIGIGKERLYPKKYRIWIRIVTILIPSEIIIPIILSILIP